MNKCPYCGAPMQENAAFCLYCMRPVADGKKHRGKIGLIVLCALLAVTVLAVGIFLAVSFLDDDGERTPSDEKSSMSDTAQSHTTGNAEPLDYEEWPIICTLEDMTVRTVYLSAVDDLSSLWEPDGFVYIGKITDDDGDDWKIYETELFLKGAALRAHFGGDGREIITSITGLTKETYEDGIRLAECMVSSVYNYTFTNLHGMLTDEEAYPRFQVPLDNELLFTAQLPDPAVNDPGSQAVLEGTSVAFDEGNDFEDQAMYIEFRTRVCNGQTVYDILLFHTQDL